MAPTTAQTYKARLDRLMDHSAYSLEQFYRIRRLAKLLAATTKTTEAAVLASYGWKTV